MADRDKPTGNIKRVNVDTEINRDPGQYPLKNGRLVTFPDIFDMPLEEGEDFLGKLEEVVITGKSVPLLKEWLTKDDYEALVAEYDTIRKLKPVLIAVFNHYTDVWGQAGEDDASKN